MKNTIVKIKELTKVYQDIVAVDHVSFEIYEGEILGLLGPNGAGKTTIIHMLLDVLAPTSGAVSIFGLDYHRHREEILRCVNFSSTYISMPYSLTVWENLRVFAQLYGVKNYREKIRELLRLFEMEALQNKLTSQLSSGQMTRLVLAKALINDPRILFLDEPTVSLDPDIADKTRTLLQDVRRKTGLTILWTSHNMKEMEEMCDRITFLHRGRIVATGTPKELIHLFEEDNLEDVFLKIARRDTPR